jgi:hypothetical protein
VFPDRGHPGRFEQTVLQVALPVHGSINPVDPDAEAKDRAPITANCTRAPKAIDKVGRKARQGRMMGRQNHGRQNDEGQNHGDRRHCGKIMRVSILDVGLPANPHHFAPIILPIRTLLQPKDDGEAKSWRAK